ncbi:hypothetical protein QR680_001001 [Steinernema hermaphroditum]|uniref:Methyltransferase domain-containing protein n=1 Tax=Steinernema hermaphroditum TaxID=289476 RepID=A0AA39LEN0_9BILA|nr:hypothetical protein QR680_001001 [Steinernema hermaphroditum]
MRGRIFFWILILIGFVVLFYHEAARNAKMYTKKLLGRPDTEAFAPIYKQEKQKMSRDWGAQFEILLNKSSPVSKWELMSLIRSEVNCPRLIKFGADEESNGHYVCNPEINAHQWHMCLIYSIGVRDSPNFETDFLNFTEHRCWNVLVDEDPIETDLARTWSVEGRVEKFSKRDKNITSLIDLMHKYRHSVLDILKFDIDDDIIPLIHSTISLFEVHTILTTITGEPRQLAQFLNKMGRFGYVLYAWEMDARKPNTLITSHVHDRKLQSLGFGERQGTYFYYTG